MRWWWRLMCRLGLHMHVTQPAPGKPWRCVDCGKELR